METGSVKIFTTGNLSRLKYIADLLLGDILGLTWEPVTDKRKLGKHPVINYSDENIPGSFKIPPSGLLSETGLKAHDIIVDRWKNLPVFFQAEDKSDFPFDIFSAAFYLVSRYEEYFDTNRDNYGRFRSADSIACKNGFLQFPVVEMWTRELAGSLVRKFQYLAFKRSEYSALITIDADESFHYLGRGMRGTFAGLFEDLTSGKGSASGRLKSISKGSGDPYDVFGYIIDSLKTSQSKATFFIPVGNHSKFDQNPSWKSEKYRDLIKKISSDFETGLHASYRAGNDFAHLQKESKHFKTILGKSPALNRFHYLRISYPESYRNLINAGISEDFSMGYSDEPGFRAGISRPFRFYDILEDRISGLLIRPFQFMDAMFFNDKRNDPVAALDAVRTLITQTRKVGGTFTSIWHNTTLLETGDGRIWRGVFEEMLRNQLP